MAEKKTGRDSLSKERSTLMKDNINNNNNNNNARGTLPRKDSNAKEGAVLVKKSSTTGKLTIYASGEKGVKGDLSSLQGLPEITYSEVKGYLNDSHKIGTGNYGTVYKGRVRGTNVAIKAMKSGKLDQSAMEQLRSEIEIWEKIRHRNIVSFYGMVLDPHNENLRILVSELMEKDVKTYLYENKNGKFKIPMLQRLWMIQNMCEGMLALSSGTVTNIIHFDLKPENLLMDKRGVVKISDFGLSRALTKRHSLPVKRGTPLWMSPELIRNDKVNTSTDVWSFGLCAYCILVGEVQPWKPEVLNMMRKEEEHRRIIGEKGLKPEFPEKNCDGELIPENAKQLVDNCLEFDPKKRPTFSQILDKCQDCIATEAIPDPRAAEFWKRHRIDYTKDGLFFSYSKIADILSSKFKIPRDKVFLMQKLFNSGSHTLSDRNAIHITDFGYFVYWFGPFDEKLFTRAEDIMTKEWFFGFLTKLDAADRLCDCEKGTFLIRASKTKIKGDAPFTISRTESATEITAQRIHRTPEGHWYVDTQSGTIFKEKKVISSVDSSFPAFIEQIKAPLKLKTALADAPFWEPETETDLVIQDYEDSDSD